jgi:hypothetical protein
MIASAFVPPRLYLFKITFSDNGQRLTRSKTTMTSVVGMRSSHQRRLRFDWDALNGVFEIRTVNADRRCGLAHWVEPTGERFGYVIVTAESTLLSLHVVDERRHRKLRRQGELLWSRS